MDEPGDFNDIVDHSGSEGGSEVGAQQEVAPGKRTRAERRRRRTRSEQFREDVRAEMGRPEFLGPVILGAVMFSVPLAWLIIAPVIEAFWPW